MAIRFLRHTLAPGLLIARALLGTGISVQAAHPGMPDYPWNRGQRKMCS